MVSSRILFGIHCRTPLWQRICLEFQTASPSIRNHQITMGWENWIEVKIVLLWHLSAIVVVFACSLETRSCPILKRSKCKASHNAPGSSCTISSLHIGVSSQLPTKREPSLKICSFHHPPFNKKTQTEDINISIHFHHFYLFLTSDSLALFPLHRAPIPFPHAPKNPLGLAKTRRRRRKGLVSSM